MDEKILKVQKHFEKIHPHMITHSFNDMTGYVSDNVIRFKCSKCEYVLLSLVGDYSSYIHVNKLYNNINYLPSCEEYKMQQALE